MADETFDAVIIGGGNKALFVAMYLIKYANMSVGIFERRHEIGGCLATEEIAAPGFRGNTHATIQLPFYPVAYGVAVCCLLECCVFIFDIVRIWRGQYE